MHNDIVCRLWELLHSFGRAGCTRLDCLLPDKVCQASKAFLHAIQLILDIRMFRDTLAVNSVQILNESVDI